MIKWLKKQMGLAETQKQAIEDEISRRSELRDRIEERLMILKSRFRRSEKEETELLILDMEYRKIPFVLEDFKRLRRRADWDMKFYDRLRKLLGGRND